LIPERNHFLDFAAQKWPEEKLIDSFKGSRGDYQSPACSGIKQPGGAENSRVSVQAMSAAWQAIDNRPCNVCVNCLFFRAWSCNDPFFYSFRSLRAATPSAILRRCGASSFQKEAKGGFPKGFLSMELSPQRPKE
jgi:hypothetical protein